MLRRREAGSAWIRRAVTAAALMSLSATGVLAIAPPARAAETQTFSSTQAIAIPAPGSSAQIGPGDPYPSAIAVTGMSGAVQDVSVVLSDLTHLFVNDLHVLLVAPTGENLVVMSDVGGDILSASHADVTLDDDGGAFPVNSALPTGSYAPADESPTPYVFPAPAPNASGAVTFAGAFAGVDPNGSWRLFVADGATGDVGEIAAGWSLTLSTTSTEAPTVTELIFPSGPHIAGDPMVITALVTSGGDPVTEGTVHFIRPDLVGYPGWELDAEGRATISFPEFGSRDETQHWIAEYSGTSSLLPSSDTGTIEIVDRTVVRNPGEAGAMYCNPGPDRLPDSGPALGYPLRIVVDDLPGVITDARVHLNGLRHGFISDLDIMLVGPSGSNLMLLSDVFGGLSDPTDVVIADDGVALPVWLAEAGTYRPTDDDRDGDANDQFPAPAPAPSDASTFGVFHGESPNGTWSLYVNDDAPGDGGALADGWCLELATIISTEITLDASTSVVAGDDVEVTATVTAAGAAVDGGTVSYTLDGGAAVDAGSPDVNGQVTFTLDGLTRGVHSLSASYSGTDDYRDSASAVLQITAAAPTTTSITLDPRDPQAHEPMEVTVDVTGDGAAVTEGSVEVSIDGVVTTVDAADLGTTSIPFTPTSDEPVTITANYSGTTEFGVSQDEVTFSPDLAPTRLSLAGPDSVITGEDAEFTVTVTGGAGPLGTGPVAEGTVSYAIDDGTPVALGGPAADGTVTFTVEDVPRGVHTIGATYTGADGYADSDAVVELTAMSVTHTTISIDPDSVMAHVPMTLSVAVTADGSPVTEGSVEVSIDGDTTTIDAAELAATPVTVTPTGTDPIAVSADFSGTTTLARSGVDARLPVAAAPAQLTLSAPASAPTDEAVLVTAQVTGLGKPVATGTVVYSVDGLAAVDAGVPDADGQVTLTVPPLARGVHTITADYIGADGWADAVAAPIEVTAVASTTTSIEVTPSDPSAHAPMSIAVSVTGDGAAVTEGTVRVTVGDEVTEIAAAELAASPISITPENTDPIIVRAEYLGATTFARSEAEATFTPKALATALVLETTGGTDGDSIALSARVVTIGEDDGSAAMARSAATRAAAAPSAALPSGTVTFALGDERVGSAPLTDGVAELSVPLPAGVHEVTASFTSTAGFGDSRDAATVEVAPVAVAGGPYEIAEGGSLTLSAAGSSQTAAISWDLDGDGSFTDATGAEVTLTWTELTVFGFGDGPTPHEIAVQAVADGLIAVASAEVTVMPEETAPPTEPTEPPVPTEPTVPPASGDDGDVGGDDEHLPVTGAEVVAPALPITAALLLLAGAGLMLRERRRKA